ncbi:hypothetical protein [Bradyrhizobium yuanmingense]|nr:hypothetical protein [Bradyrhizobium yuanmingense]
MQASFDRAGAVKIFGLSISPSGREEMQLSTSSIDPIEGAAE